MCFECAQIKKDSPLKTKTKEALQRANRTQNVFWIIWLIAEKEETYKTYVSQK